MIHWPISTRIFTHIHTVWIFITKYTVSVLSSFQFVGVNFSIFFDLFIYFFSTLRFALQMLLLFYKYLVRLQITTIIFYRLILTLNCYLVFFILFSPLFCCSICCVWLFFRFFFAFRTLMKPCRINYVGWFV